MIGRRLVSASLLAFALSVTALQPSRAQVPGMTMDQFNWYLERTDAFCSWYTDPANANASTRMELWNAGYRIPATTGSGGKQLYWVFKKGEVSALVKHCTRLMELMKRAGK